MNSLKIHYLQHVPFEGIGYIEDWANKNRHQLKGTKLFNEETLPEQSEFDVLIVMGGPMGVSQEKDYPWLKEEKRFIQSSISANKKVIGICLGAQLIAEVLGAKVYSNHSKEIGWFPIQLVKGVLKCDKDKDLFENCAVLHWHGDTFDLPQEAIHLFESEVCKNQAFLYKTNVLGLQFHLESTPETLKEMIYNCKDELVSERNIQRERELRSNSHLSIETNILLDKIFDRFLSSNINCDGL
ncbi:type 1 glutamine amidotransferase [Halosquirtibacter xylanolyticus]|uniref:type 1 glutamine amidotransferase n=1 Tax=Halosquirtibacter xylanolyticus TaxID=3374599 RepID=UPI00374A3CE6|nr:type 1 glutamine amidotransferase [Prolixibacteraceae bacterium]